MRGNSVTLYRFVRAVVSVGTHDGGTWIPRTARYSLRDNRRRLLARLTPAPTPAPSGFFADLQADLQALLYANPSTFDWSSAQPGDELPDGSILVRRLIPRKKTARLLAVQVGGRVALDGARHWAVIKPRPAVQP